MSELRQDPITSDWVVFATERGKRPQHMPKKTRVEQLPDKEPTCPFCPGNELRTPPESYRYPRGSQLSDWQVRVVPNAFPALSMKGTTERKIEGRFFHWMDGFGVHEVIIDTPSHNTPMALLPYDHVEQVINAYLDRYNKLSRNRFLRYVTIFKNQGWVAGTSLAHPHSQLVATPVASPNYRRNLEYAVNYFEDAGGCLYCDLLSREREKGTRIVSETPRFTVFHPYASRSPYETWIMPREHCASFGCVRGDDVSEMARVLKDTLFAIYSVLDNPDFNFMILTSTTGDENDPYYHWYLKIVPRISTIAGFEMGSGMNINSVFPEETAAIMRDFVNNPQPAAGVGSG